MIRAYLTGHQPGTGNVEGILKYSVKPGGSSDEPMEPARVTGPSERNDLPDSHDALRVRQRRRLVLMGWPLLKRGTPLATIELDGDGVTMRTTSNSPSLRPRFRAGRMVRQRRFER